MLCMTKEQEEEFKKISWTTVVIRSLMEFSSVLFQLVCFSRLGANDYYYLVNHKTGETEQRSQDEPSLAANLVLFVTLVLFQFPFMNAYILFMYDLCVIARSSWSRIAGCFWLLGMQIVGVVMAWLVIRDVQGRWKGTVKWIVPAFEATDNGREMWAEFWEEFFAVLALLVGYVHVTYLNFGKLGLFRSREHLFSEFSEVTRKLPVPMTFIMQVTLLVAGLLRAFPTAHLSPHISCYLLIMRYTTWAAFYFRMVGGFAAFCVAYVLFWAGYTLRTEVQPWLGQTPEAEKKERMVGSRQHYQEIPTHQPEVAVVTPDDVFQRSGTAISFNNAYRHVYAA